MSTNDGSGKGKRYRLTDTVMKSFRLAKSFHNHSGRINSLDFSPNGEKLLSSSDDDSISVCDLEPHLVNQRTMFSKKYGVAHIRYTHSGTSAIHASTKLDHTIRHLSLADNRYLRYFLGHTDKVTSLAMSPGHHEVFLSTSLDKTVRLWDNRSANVLGTMHLSSLIQNEEPPLANFGPEGLVFAIGYNNQTIRLYDVRNFSKNCVSEFIVKNTIFEHAYSWSNLKFSPDGSKIMISTKGSLIHLINAYTGEHFRRLGGFTNSRKESLEATFTPDSKYLLSGADGHVAFWNLESGVELPMMMSFGGNSEEDMPVYCVKFNPRFMIMASASKSINISVPGLVE